MTTMTLFTWSDMRQEVKVLNGGVTDGQTDALSATWLPGCQLACASSCSSTGVAAGDASIAQGEDHTGVLSFGLQNQ